MLEEANKICRNLVRGLKSHGFTPKFQAGGHPSSGLIMSRDASHMLRSKCGRVFMYTPPPEKNGMVVFGKMMIVGMFLGLAHQLGQLRYQVSAKSDPVAIKHG